MTLFDSSESSSRKNNFEKNENRYRGLDLARFVIKIKLKKDEADWWVQSSQKGLKEFTNLCESVKHILDFKLTPDKIRKKCNKNFSTEKMNDEFHKKVWNIF